MRHLVMTSVVAALAVTFATAASATNTPCSKGKGGIRECRGGKFVCNDGSTSASKKICSSSSDGGEGAPSDDASSERTDGKRAR